MSERANPGISTDRHLQMTNRLQRFEVRDIDASMSPYRLTGAVDAVWVDSTAGAVSLVPGPAASRPGPFHVQRTAGANAVTFDPPEGGSIAITTPVTVATNGTVWRTI